MIPEAKQLAVAGALRTAFGVYKCEDIHPLSGGLSTALVYKISIRKNAYCARHY